MTTRTPPCLAAMSRKDLQVLAKENCIRANLSSAAIISKLLGVDLDPSVSLKKAARADSRLCELYIERGDDFHLTLSESTGSCSRTCILFGFMVRLSPLAVVDKMAYMRWLHEYTDYASVLYSSRERISDRGEHWDAD